jgi:hypothetical protein
MHLGTETAADIRCYNPQLVLRNTDGFRDPAPVHMRNLARNVDRQRAIGAGLGDDGARFHAGRDQPVVDDAQSNELIGIPRGFLVIATANPKHGRDVVGHVVVELWRAVANRGLFIDHRGQRLVVDIDSAQGIVGFGLRRGHHQGHAFADETHALDGDDRAGRHLGSRNDPVRDDGADLSRQVLAGKRQADAGRGAGCGEIDAADDGMGMRRSQDRHMQHARQLDVVDVAAVAGDELEILPPPQRLADIFESWHHLSHGHEPPQRAIQPRVRCCGSRCIGRCCR